MLSNRFIKKNIFSLLIITLATVCGISYIILSNNKKVEIGKAKCDTESKYLGLKIVELASTESQREQGLMNRQEICENQGMLFEFSDNQNRSFWMKNTYISLDIIFIDSSGRIVNIEAETVPKRLFPTYDSKFPAKYVLETSAGHSRKHDIKINDSIDLNRLKSLTVDYGSVVN